VCVNVKTLWTLALALLIGASAFQSAAAPSAGGASAAAKSRTTPGIEAAKAISLITGVAISPLLGVGAVGAWEYFSVPPEQRTRLPWYAQPAFWIPALMLVAMAGAKDIFGTALPTLLKKPFDVAETIEDKISALVVAGAFVPLVASIFPRIAEYAAAGTFPAAGFAAIDGVALFNFVAVPLAIAIFFVVWLASHALNILILISPFTTVDAALKLGRLALLALLTAVSFMSPYAGAVLAVVIIVAAYFIAGWAFRLMVFGNVYAWDFVTMRHKRFRPELEGNWMFTAHKVDEVPIRTWGKLVRTEDGLAFQYRPWLILPRKALVLHAGSYAVGRGLAYPEIMRLQAGTGKTLFILPPRFRSHEQRLAEIYGLAQVRDVGLLKGFRAIWNWSRNLFGLGRTLPVQQVAPA
jgi:MFS family permease